MHSPLIRMTLKDRSHNFTKLKSIKTLPTDLQSVCCWPPCDPCRDLPVRIWCQILFNEVRYWDWLHWVAIRL